MTLLPAKGNYGASKVNTKRFSSFCFVSFWFSPCWQYVTADLLGSTHWCRSPFVIIIVLIVFWYCFPLNPANSTANRYYTCCPWPARTLSLMHTFSFAVICKMVQLKQTGLASTQALVSFSLTSLCVPLRSQMSHPLMCHSPCLRCVTQSQQHAENDMVFVASV